VNQLNEGSNPSLPPIHYVRTNNMQFRFEIKLEDNGLAILEGSSVKYWAGQGLPTYEGGLDGLAILFPKVIKQLLATGLIKQENNALLV
jgi:hypothetical protein